MYFIGHLSYTTSGICLFDVYAGGARAVGNSTSHDLIWRGEPIDEDTTGTR